MHRVTLLGSLLIAAGLPLQAQDVCSQYRPTPVQGSWAQYKSNRNGQDIMTRMAVVGHEKRDGKDAVWFETSTESPRGKMINEVLVPTYPFEQTEVMEVVMKRGDQPATKLSPGMMAMMRGGMGGQGQGGQGSAPGAGRGAGGGRGMGMTWAQQCKGLTVVGAESVTVPAGTFKVTHLRNVADSTDVWVSRETPFGLVKSTGPRGAMELQSTGKDAKKSITETPQEAQMPGM